jgi:hypothetical protein
MKLILIQIINIILILLLLGYTDPSSVNLIIYLAVFGLIYIFCLVSIYMIIKVAYPNLSNYRQVFVAIVLAFSPVSLLAIGTLSSLKLLDVVLCIGVPSAIVWYGLRQIAKK